jgi:hypothetical protein
MLILSSFALLYPLSTLVRARLATCCFDASALYCFLMLLLLRRDACVACTHACRHCFRVWLHACRLRPPLGTDGCTWTDARTHDPAMTASSRRPAMCWIRLAPRPRRGNGIDHARSTLTFSVVFTTENGQSIEKGAFR